MFALLRTRRLASAAFTAAVWVCLGLMLPIFASLYSSEIVSHGVVASPQDTFTIARPVVLAATPAIRVDRGTITVVDQTGKPTKLPSSGVAPSLLLDNAAIALARSNSSAPSSLDTPEASAPLVQALAATRYETLFLRRTTLTLELPGRTLEPIYDVQATVSLKRKGVLAIKGSGAFRGQRIDLDLQANGLLADPRAPGGQMPVRIALKGAMLEAHLDGKLDTDTGLRLSGQGDLSLGSLRQMARWLGAFWSKGSGLRDLHARGQLSLTPEMLAFDQAVIRMDGNEATGALAVAFTKPRPQVSGTLAYRTFDATPYQEATDVGEGRDGFSWTSIASEALTAPLGMNLDADIRVSADKVMLGNIELGPSAATVALKDGRLLADVAELRIAGGEGGGQIGADFTGSTPRLSLRGKLEGVDLARLTRVLGGSGILQAPATVVADLAATGGTGRDLLSSLAGKLNVRTTGAGRLGLDLKQLSTTAGTDASPTDWTTASTGRTSLEQLDIKLVLRDGVVLTETAEATGPDGAWTATGIANLVTQNIDFRLMPAGPAGPAGAKALRPGRQPVMIDIKGPLFQPTVRATIEQSTPPLAAEKPGAGQN